MADTGLEIEFVEFGDGVRYPDGEAGGGCGFAAWDGEESAGGFAVETELVCLAFGAWNDPGGYLLPIDDGDGCGPY